MLTPPLLSSATLFCYDNADTSSACKIKYANTQRSKNTNLNTNTDLQSRMNDVLQCQCQYKQCTGDEMCKDTNERVENTNMNKKIQMHK